jgi:hypothetical protein
MTAAQFSLEEGSRMRTVICVFLLTVGLAFAANAGDGSCDRYVQGEGSELSIKHDCVLQQELPPLFVQKSEKGTFEILVTRIDTSEGQALWRATHDWLGNEGNLRDLTAQIQLVAGLAKSDRMVIEGRHSQMESINYAVGQWLKRVGAADSILADAQAIQVATSNAPEVARTLPGGSQSFEDNGIGDATMSTNGCSDIPVCTACKIYYCGQLGGRIICGCRWWGNSCCVIDLQI